MLDNFKKQVYESLMQLPKTGLVMGTSGNASARKGEKVIIKPSGVAYNSLSPLDLVVVDLEGNKIEGGLKPSVDTGAHLQIYRNNKSLGGVIHTHSPYATAFAALDKEIPVYLTELADYFGKSIEVSDFVPPGEERIGMEFQKGTTEGRFRGILMKNHGVFTAGRNVNDALKAAITIEHCAKVSYLAENFGSPEPLPPEIAERLNQNYLDGYGQ